jgi:hypothetical protein
MPRTIALIAALMLLAALAEFALGRQLWGTSGKPGLWSGEINSSSNSQYVADPYSFTHITHGIVLYGLVSLVFRKVPVSTRLILVVALEAGWEVLENTSLVIEWYRAETISLNYYGDSVVNSMSDILACIAGSLLAARLPTRAAVIGTVALEILLLFWMRDNLILNILMLIYPSRAIKICPSAPLRLLRDILLLAQPPLLT